MTDQTDGAASWVVIGTYNTGLEADMARQLLESENIPVLVQSNAPGIFGAGFQGAVTGGIVLRVPSPEFDRATQIVHNDP